MAAATPKKLVHWALNASLSDLASPFSEGTSTSSCSSTSSLQYINSQLLSHGYVHDEGLSLDGLSNGDANRVVKCLLGMLSQRIDDMSRTEDLTAKLRTLSYDHERLSSMYKTESERAANAEREMNLHKSRMAAATKSLQSSENAHKHTSAELQRTRTTLHALRAAHQTDIKKLEKEKERMVERWSKLSDAQLKIGSLRAGLTCANLNIVEASDVQLRGKGRGFLDVSLEQAETARKELFEHNRKLRGLLLSAANELQTLLHAIRAAGDLNASEQPAPLALSALSSNPHVEATSELFSCLFSALRETVLQKVEQNNAACTCSRTKQSSSPSPQSQITKAQNSSEIDRMQAVIGKLRAELDLSKKEAAAAAAQTQELFEHFSEDQRITSNGATERSVDLITAPMEDDERNRLDARFNELEEERGKFTEAAVRLGREKAALEAERLRFHEEKRSWEVEMMLAELPPTPAPAPSSSTAPPPPVTRAASPSILPRGSPRRSPRKLKAKAASPRKIRVPRRSSGLGAVVLSPKAKKKVAPAYETEVIPLILSSPSRQMPDFKTSMAAPSPPPSALLTSAFILPPPSPAASLPSRISRGTSLPPIPPLPKFEIPPSSLLPDDSIMEIISEPVTSSSSGSVPAQPIIPVVPVPSTPVVRPFPMAKPFAQRMIHAYSPVKPSPLSRILMLADSPDSPDIPKLDALVEVDENAMDTTLVPVPTLGHAQPIRSLAEELGVLEDDGSPLRERQPPAKSQKAAKDKDKGKARAAPAPAPTVPSYQTSRARAGGVLEKENVKRAKLSNPSAGQGGSAKSGGKKPAVKPPPLSGGGARERARWGTMGRMGPSANPATKGGARRVPIGSAEAAAVPSWRG